LKDDDGASELNKSTVPFGSALPPSSKAAKAIVPTVRPLDYPTPRLALDAPDEWRLASSSDVWLHSAGERFHFWVVVVVAFVEAEVLG
jgi:hypothetical protein